MSSFKLVGDDDAPKPTGDATPKPDSSAPAEEFSYFLEDDGAAKPSAPAPPKPAAPPVTAPAPTAPTPAAGTPGAAAMPARPAGAPRPAGAAPVPNPVSAPGRTGVPTSPTDATKAAPNLMRPAVRPPGAQPADPSQPGLNMKAAQAVTPVLTEPDAAAIAQSATPSDDFSSGLQDLGARFAGILDAGADVFTWVARIAVLAVGFSLAVLLAAIFFGGASSITPETFVSNPKSHDLVNFMLLASKGLTLGMLGLAVSMLLLTYDDNRLGALVAAIGVLFYFGMPLILPALLGATNPAMRPLAFQFFSIGKIILILGLFKALIDVALWLWNLPNKIKAKQSFAGAVGFGNPVESKQQQLARTANMFSPCWKLPFCREPIRVLCPAFLAKKTCWKFGRGCYCDTEMVGRIVRNEPLEVIKAANTVQSQQPPPCARCYIFLEHQTHKFRMLSPLVLPSTIVFMLGIWPLYNRLFLSFTTGYTKLFASFSFSTAGLTPDAIKTTAASQAEAAAANLSPTDIAQVSSYMLGALFGFFVLIYLSKFVEWAIFKAKW